MYEFSVSVHGDVMCVECYNRKVNTAYAIYASRDHDLVVRLYKSLRAADHDQVAEIMQGWSGCHNPLELRRIEDILNRKKNLFYEPKTKAVLNITDVYKDYKRDYAGYPWSEYVARRIKNKSLLDHVTLIAEGGRRAYVAKFV